MILVVSGATGGHLYPAIAICNQLNVPAHTVVSRHHPASEILTAAHMTHTICELSLKKWWLLPVNILNICWLLFRVRPQVLLLMGGGICVPFAILSWLFRIPSIGFEQNAIPGRATRLVQWFVEHLITSFPEAESLLSVKKKIKCLGNPIRFNDQDNNDQLPIEIEHLSGDTILVVGGSQGARGLNAFVDQQKNQILNQGMNIIHLAGAAFFKDKDANRIVQEVNGCHYIAIPYANKMVSLFKKSTVVMCRAGATTLAELQHFGLPAILVPFPFAKDNHQHANAKAFCNQQSNARLINEADLTWEWWLQNIKDIRSSKPTVSTSADQVLNSICEIIQTFLK
ncbi:MAG: UDP-N-acetylglucosamine--N-acetylmuramyl-(pentapeptide) pyrophosphoryl-undecaprenol N-acetylglucosamine transferase [Candidatus Marinamargulisbacteria bacterium]